MIPSDETGRWRLESLVPYLPSFWLAGSCSTLSMLATGLIGVHRLRRSSRLLESGEIPRRLRMLGRFAGDCAARQCRHLRPPGRAGLGGNRPAADSSAAGCS